MYVTRIPNRDSPPAVLLRESYRENGKDLANLTRNTVRFGDARPTTILSRPTPTQTRAFDLLGLKIAA